MVVGAGIFKMCHRRWKERVCWPFMGGGKSKRFKKKIKIESKVKIKLNEFRPIRVRHLSY